MTNVRASNQYTTNSKTRRRVGEGEEYWRNVEILLPALIPFQTGCSITLVPCSRGPGDERRFVVGGMDQIPSTVSRVKERNWAGNEW